MLISNKLLYDL